jgi:hypothetical protein
MVTYQWGDLVDQDDKLKILINPESEYAIAARNAFGRIMDDVILAAMFGTAFAGPDGATGVTIPSTGGALTTGQYVARTALTNDLTNQNGPTGTTTDGSSLSVQRLRLIKYLFDSQDVDPDEERFIAVSPNALKNMLFYTQVTSADYNTVKALAEGAIDSFMGFKFIMTTRLPQVSVASPLGVTYQPIASISNANDRLLVAWARQGVGFALQEDVLTEIAKRPDMSFSTQVYMEMVMGATRIEEAKVVIAPVAEV